MDYPYPFKEEHWDEYLQQVNDGNATPKQEMFSKAIIEKATGEMIGASHFLLRDGKPCIHGEIFLLPEAAGKGFGTEYMKAECDFIFTKTDSTGILAGLFTDNKASGAMQRKVGFEIPPAEEGSPRHCPATGEERQYVTSSFPKEKWLQIQRANEQTDMQQ